jgi:hypothetical protein
MDPYYQPKIALSGGFETLVALTAAANGVTQVIAALQTTPSSNPKQHYIHVQRLRIVVKTGSAGVTWTFQDGAGSPVTLTAALDMSTAGAVYTFDFGPQGKKLTLNKDLNVSISGAGAAADIFVEGFQERSATRIVTIVSLGTVSGAAAGGTSVKIYGTNFAAGVGVTFGGVAATVVRPSADEQSLTCITGAHGAGAVNVVVTNTDGSTATSVGAYTYV